MEEQCDEERRREAIPVGMGAGSKRKRTMNHYGIGLIAEGVARIFALHLNVLTLLNKHLFGFT